MKNETGKTILNVIWFIFIGLINSISSALLGVSYCITLIGIPFGLQYFKFINLVAFPSKKYVVTHFAKDPLTCFLNILWVTIGGGFVAHLINIVAATILSITIVGIPFASQLLKIASFNLAPFGIEILEEGKIGKEVSSFYQSEMVIDRLNYYYIVDKKRVQDFINQNNNVLKVNFNTSKAKEINEKNSNFIHFIKRYLLTFLCVSIGLLLFILIWNYTKDTGLLFILLILFFIFDDIFTQLYHHIMFKRFLKKYNMNMFKNFLETTYGNDFNKEFEYKIFKGKIAYIKDNAYASFSTGFMRMYISIYEIKDKKKHLLEKKMKYKFINDLLTNTYEIKES